MNYKKHTPKYIQVFIKIELLTEHICGCGAKHIILVQMLEGRQMVSLAPVSNITSVLSVSRLILHVIKWCQHVHLQQLQHSWLISSVVYFIIIVAPAERSLVTLWPCCCKLPSPPNENEMALHLTRRPDLSHTDHYFAPEIQGSFAAHPVTVFLFKKKAYFHLAFCGTHIKLFSVIFVSHDMGWTWYCMVLDAGLLIQCSD